MDNWLNKPRLYNFTEDQYINIDLDGKNLTYLSIKGKIYIIYYFKPLIVYELNINI